MNRWSLLDRLTGIISASAMLAVILIISLDVYLPKLIKN